jgi:hypothetical protein
MLLRLRRYMMLAFSRLKHVPHTSTLKMEAEMPATLLTSTWYNNPRTESTSIINHYESLKSVHNKKLKNVSTRFTISVCPLLTTQELINGFS